MKPVRVKRLDHSLLAIYFVLAIRFGVSATTTFTVAHDNPIP